jgi:hypothetical protein
MSESTGGAKDPRRHWEALYAKRAPDEVSWFEPSPET